MFQGDSKTGRRKRRSRLLQFALTALMLSTMFQGLIGQFARDVAAEETPTPTEEAIVEPTPEPTTEAPMPTETPHEVDPPTAEMTPAPSVVAGQPGATMQNVVYRCGSEFNVAEPVMVADFASYCSTVDGVSMAVASPNGVLDSGESANGGVVDFTELPQESLTVSFGSVPKHGLQYVGCKTSTDGTFGDGPFEQIMLIDGSKITIKTDFAPNWRCIWLTVAEEELQRRLIAYKHICESDALEGDFSAFAVDPAPFIERCRPVEDGEGPFAWTVTDMNADTVATATYGESLANGIAVSSLPAGDLHVYEEYVPGYVTAAVMCTKDASGSVTWAQMPVTDDRVSLTEYDTDSVICHWFNERYSGGQIEVLASLCPDTFEVTSTTTVTQLLGACNEPMDGVAFRLDDANGATVRTGSSGSSNLPWRGIDAGTYTLVAEAPYEYELVYVQCFAVESMEGAASDEVLNQRIPLDPKPTVAIDLKADQSLYCFAVHAHEGPTVTLRIFQCPSMEADAFDRTRCLTPQPNTRIDVQPVDGGPVTTGITDAQGTTVIPADGRIFANVEPTPGMTLKRASCAVTILETGVTNVSDHFLTDSRIEIALDKRARFDCTLYNLPDSETFVQLQAYACDAGMHVDPETDQTIGMYRGVCDDVMPNLGYRWITDKSPSQLGEITTNLYGSAGLPLNGLDPFYDGIRIYVDVAEGYLEPVTFCTFIAYDSDFVSPDNDELLSGGSIDHDLRQGDYLACALYYVPEASPSTVTITKWQCPVFEESLQDEHAWLQERCTTPMADVTFSLEAKVAKSLKTATDGTVIFQDVPAGSFTVTEAIPDGYGQPSVYCSRQSAAEEIFSQRVDAPNGVWDASMTYDGTQIHCDWFNIPDQPATLTIVKHWCEPGYDLHGFEADPATDCDEPGAGIAFELSGDARETDDEGFVVFGDLDPGTYAVTEIWPDDVASSFVLNCFGGRYAGIQAYPLSTGPQLEVTLVASDRVTCHWFNVPRMEDGKIVVTAHMCATATFRSEVDCNIYEGGMPFSLTDWVSGDPVTMDTTDAFGKVVFAPLDGGSYVLVVEGVEMCSLVMSNPGDDGGEIVVDDGEATTVDVYVCDPSSTPKPPKTTKYPNTGADPTALDLPNTGSGTDEDSDRMERAIVGLLGAVTVLGTVLLRRRPTEERADDAPSHPARRVFIGGALAALLMPVVATAQDGDDDGSDAEGTPEGTPDVPPCREDATPDAEDEDPDCIRGEVPRHITIEAIGVDAEIEIQEIVAGAMQDPTGPAMVTWYKETSRLGERGNGIYAGHLNYWGVPEGVFFGLKSLQPGDEIVMTGENDEEFAYAVQWVENQAGQEAPEMDVLGLTEDEAITLITCGGEWDTTIAEYNERTTVRAVRLRAVPEG